MIENENLLYKEDNKGLSLDTLLARAKAAEDNKKYTIAANHYYTALTRLLDKLAQKEELFKFVCNSFCYLIILLPVNMQRERMLNYILKNENLNIFEQKHFLEKIFRYQLISEDELTKFLENKPDKFNDRNAFERAIFEHNLVSLSNIYENINFATLQKFLHIDIDKILNYTFKMIFENKINAKIDEVNEFIYFQAEQTDGLFFDKQINNFCVDVMQLAEYIKRK